MAHIMKVLKTIKDMKEVTVESGTSVLLLLTYQMQKNVQKCMVFEKAEESQVSSPNHKKTGQSNSQSHTLKTCDPVLSSSNTSIQSRGKRPVSESDNQSCQEDAEILMPSRCKKKKTEVVLAEDIIKQKDDDTCFSQENKQTREDSQTGKHLEEATTSVNAEISTKASCSQSDELKSTSLAYENIETSSESPRSGEGLSESSDFRLQTPVSSGQLGFSASNSESITCIVMQKETSIASQDSPAKPNIKQGLETNFTADVPHSQNSLGDYSNKNFGCELPVLNSSQQAMPLPMSQPEENVQLDTVANVSMPQQSSLSCHKITTRISTQREDSASAVGNTNRYSQAMSCSTVVQNSSKPCGTISSSVPQINQTSEANSVSHIQSSYAQYYGTAYNQYCWSFYQYNSQMYNGYGTSSFEHQPVPSGISPGTPSGPSRAFPSFSCYPQPFGYPGFQAHQAQYFPQMNPVSGYWYSYIPVAYGSPPTSSSLCPTAGSEPQFSS
nr:PREDICTED: uncharacterized protein LOC102350390 [Latimeria chalumnae]|eukprot:XP_014349918.1 PREDICTED: uncharacterized protein LOC102350390 [Latimeria chalumnae]